jgi:hypothetical protein
MKIFINTIAGIAFIGQLIAFIFNGLTLQKLESIVDELFNYALFAGYLCSLLSVAFFVIIYNFNLCFLRKKMINILFLAIVLLGGYVLISQLFVQHDFILTSCLLLLFDIYIVRRVLHILCTASTKSGKA